MNLKKILANVLVCCIVGGVLPTVEKVTNNTVITASAVDYTEGTYKELTYRNYGDHIKITGCDNSATEVVIPAEIDGLPVKIIGGYEFVDGYYGFSWHENLTSITIPDSVTSIESQAFESCSSLASVTIPNSVTSIGDEAFERCSSLTSVTIPNSVINIGYGVFSGCTGLTSVEIPNSVTSIGRYAFSNCDNLTSIEISDSVTSIRDGTFCGCDNLTSIEIPDSVTSIGENAFVNCRSLKSIEIPESVTSIGDFAFRNCYNLTSVKVFGSVESIGRYAFNNCNDLTSVEVLGSVESIGQYAFSDCVKLTRIEIIGGVTNISAGAFSKCHCLKSIELMDSVISIGDDAFYNSGLTSITILNPECEIYDDERTISNGYYFFESLYFNGTIIGYENSTVQAYAEKYGYKFESLGEAPDNIMGDVNDDGIFNISDIVLLQKWLLAVPDTKLVNWKAADLCKDGRIDVFDLCLLKRKLVNG